MNGNPDARKESASIPPGFQPMPAMVTVPIIGHTASIQPINAGHDHRVPATSSHAARKEIVMSNKEKCLTLLDSFTDGQLGNIAAMLEAAKAAMEEAADEAFCRALYQEYEADPDKGQPISIEEAARQLGVVL